MQSRSFQLKVEVVWYRYRAIPIRHLRLRSELEISSTGWSSLLAGQKPLAARMVQVQVDIQVLLRDERLSDRTPVDKPCISTRTRYSALGSPTCSCNWIEDIGVDQSRSSCSVCPKLWIYDTGFRMNPTISIDLRLPQPLFEQLLDFLAIFILRWINVDRQ